MKRVRRRRTHRDQRGGAAGNDAKNYNGRRNNRGHWAPVRCCHRRRPRRHKHRDPGGGDAALADQASNAHVSRGKRAVRRRQQHHACGLLHIRRRRRARAAAATPRTRKHCRDLRRRRGERDSACRMQQRKLPGRRNLSHRTSNGGGGRHHCCAADHDQAGVVALHCPVVTARAAASRSRFRCARGRRRRRIIFLVATRWLSPPSVGDSRAKSTSNRPG